MKDIWKILANYWEHLIVAYSHAWFKTIPNQLIHLNKGNAMKKEQERQSHFGASVQLSTIPISRAHTRYPAHCLSINETKIQRGRTFY